MSPAAQMNPATRSRVESKWFPAFAWSVLVYNIAVILWGALVRATSSGAGCGGHWPLCNGDALPALAQAATRIEFIHRMMSGGALIAVVALPLWAAQVYAKGHPARRWAVWSLVFIVTEALLGAALVLLGYVAKDQSLGRTISLSLHLINTFTLLACLSLTAWWASRDSLPGTRSMPWNFRIAIGAVLLVSVAGAITALGDTLFPSRTLADGMRDDFSAQANFLIRLRVIHPVLAVLSALYLAALAFPRLKEDRLLAGSLLALLGAQLTAGAANVLLQAPLAMQLLHLLISDALWVALILLANRPRVSAVN